MEQPADVSTDEGKADERLLGKLGQLGTITVKCYRAKLGEIEYHGDKVRSRQDQRGRCEDFAQQAAAKQKFRALLADDAIPEKNLKGRAISHQAK